MAIKPKSSATRFTAFISKYALSTGIQEIEVEDCFRVSPDMVKFAENTIQIFHKGEWFRTREEAVVKADDMRRKKIASLEKQIKKLKGMTF